MYPHTPGQLLRKVCSPAKSCERWTAPTLFCSLTSVPFPPSCITVQRQFPSSHPVNQHKMALTVADHRVGRGGWWWGGGRQSELECFFFFSCFFFHNGAHEIIQQDYVKGMMASAASRQPFVHCIPLSVRAAWGDRHEAALHAQRYDTSSPLM